MQFLNKWIQFTYTEKSLNCDLVVKLKCHFSEVSGEIKLSPFGKASYLAFEKIVPVSVPESLSLVNNLAPIRHARPPVNQCFCQ